MTMEQAMETIAVLRKQVLQQAKKIASLRLRYYDISIDDFRQPRQEDIDLMTAYTQVNWKYRNSIKELTVVAEAAIAELRDAKPVEEEQDGA